LNIFTGDDERGKQIKNKIKRLDKNKYLHNLLSFPPHDP
jgi:hypothetical protein